MRHKQKKKNKSDRIFFSIEISDSDDHVSESYTLNSVTHWFEIVDREWNWFDAINLPGCWTGGVINVEL